MFPSFNTRGTLVVNIQQSSRQFLLESLEEILTFIPVNAFYGFLAPVVAG